MVPLILKGLTDNHIWKQKQKQKSAMFLTKRCWYPRQKVHALSSTCGRCHPEGFIVASFYGFKYIAKNHANNVNNNDTNNNKLSSCINFHLHIIFTFQCQFSCFCFPFLVNKNFLNCCLVSHYLRKRYQTGSKT